MGRAGGVPQAGVKPVLVLQKARVLLDCFGPETASLTVQELRCRSGLPASTCIRLLATLVAEGFLDRVGDRYRPGLALLRWAAAAEQGDDLIHASRPAMDLLRDRTGETVALFVRDGAVRVCVAIAHTRHVVVHQLRVGMVLPLHAGSAGKVHLAFDADARALLGDGELTGYTPSTVTDPAVLDVELVRIREQGFAASYEERHAGVSSISAPIYNRSQLAAALVIAGPVQRVNAHTTSGLVGPLLHTAREVSEALGWLGPARMKGLA